MSVGGPVRVGVVGFGRFGRTHARTLSGLAEAELACIVEPDATARGRAAAEFPGLPLHESLTHALQADAARAWVIATQTATHVALAKEALAAGGAVLVEKPLARTADEARQLADLIAPGSSNFMAGHVVLFANRFRRLVEEARARGPVVHFHAVRHRPISTADHYPDETPLSLTMVHDLYLALALMGGREPVEMRARLQRTADGRCDLALAELVWDDGAVGSFTASFLTPPGMPADGFDRCEVFGRGWAASLSLNPQPLQVWQDRSEFPLTLEIDDDPASPSGWLAEELRQFCRVAAGRGKVPLGVRYEDAVRVQDWLERLQSSAKGAE